MSAIVDKLKKLIAMEQSSRSIGNQAEAEAFASKIASMLSQHKISMSDVEAEAQAISDPFGTDYVTETNKSSKQVWTWRIRLASSVCRSLFCRSFYTEGQDRLLFVGRKSDREMAIAMYRHLVETCKGLQSSELRAAKKVQAIHISDLAWKKAFSLGFSEGVCLRLATQHANLLSSQQTGTGMILRAEAELTAYVQQTVRSGAGRSRSNPHDANAFARGHHHGSQVVMTRRLALGGN